MVGSILKNNMTEPITESEKALAFPHLSAAIETKSAMAKDWRLLEFFRHIYLRDAVALHYTYVKLGRAMMLAQTTSAAVEEYES